MQDQENNLFAENARGGKMKEKVEKNGGIYLDGIGTFAFKVEVSLDASNAMPTTWRRCLMKGSNWDIMDSAFGLAGFLDGLPPKTVVLLKRGGNL